MTPRARELARGAAGQAVALAFVGGLARAVGRERSGLRSARYGGWAAAAGATAGMIGLTAGIRGTLSRRPRSRRWIARELEAVDSLNPQTRAEATLWTVLAVQAGILEELIWRGLLPGLLLGGDARTAVSRATLPIFGLGHAYQGAYRVITTAAIGLLLAEVARAGRSVQPAIATHIAFDLQLLWLMDHPLRPSAAAFC